ncbi:MAG TPA: DUF4157 domain-containing protein [Methanotrichaceae archaeon]|nr:DUF4157 domain-containing protein [Methanotrichaceae archaeon]
MSQGLQTHIKAVKKPSSEKAQEKRLQPEPSRLFSGESSACRRKKGVLQRSTHRQAPKIQRSTGAPLDQANQATIEPRFAYDFSRIPAHHKSLINIQAKLTVNALGDPYEEEADRVAQLVSRPQNAGSPASVRKLQVGMSNHAISPFRISPFVQRSASDDGGSGGFAGSMSEPALEAQLLGGAISGQPLPFAVRERMEDRFGVNFRDVLIHTGIEAHRMADEVEALAFTHGRNIYFATGAYAPGTTSGDSLLAHELTHVVQQSGGASLPSGLTTIQRYRIRGPAFHKGTEDRFVAANKGLVTEAPLPGATSMKSFDFEAVGFPDLYKSDVKDTAIGVRGEYETAKDVNPSDDPNKKRRYVALRNLERTAKPKDRVTYSPIPQGDTLPLSAEFPEKVEVGDIKPIWMVAGKPVVEGAALGTAQLANYQTGIAEFVKTAAADKKVKRGTISTGVLSGLTIPPELDYKNFEKENKSPSKNIILTGDITGKRRYWMFEPPGTGLYYYFHLAHPNPSPEARDKLEDAFNKLEPVKKDLHVPDDGINSKLGLSKMPKRRSGASGRRRQQAVDDPRRKGALIKGFAYGSTQGNVHASTAIQRKEGTRTEKNWSALGKAWEEKRDRWDKQYAKPFLGSKEGKALQERVEINDKLGLKNDTSVGSIADLGRHLKTVELWSGKTGWLLGKARFALGSTFDKIAKAFEWVKEKLSKFWEKLVGAKSPDVGIGWRKTLVNLLVKAVKLGFRELVSVFFEMCTSCLEGIFQKVVRKFTEDISEELQKHVCELQKQFKGYEDLLKTEFEKRFGSWNQLIEDLSTAQQWANILFSMEALIRLGLQAVSCLSPPALGCLWGLVAQVGLDVALSLIMGTQWFQEHVINHPSVRGLIKQFAGPTIRSLIADTLRGVGLEDYAKDIEPCSKVKDLEAPPVPPIDPIPADKFQEHRAEWEKANRSQMLQDLQFRFHSSLGVPATEAELERLVDAMARSGKSPEQLKEIIESTPKWSNGKYDLGAIRRRLTGTSDRPGTGGPSRPEVGISKRIVVPGSSSVEVGPQVFQPPPGEPSGEKGSILPGAKIRF